MIFGIGIDTVEIARIEKSMTRENFTNACFTAAERAELAGKKVQSAAACYAAKEAFFKALGTGLYPQQLLEVALLHHENGRPYLAFGGGAALTMAEEGLAAHVSVTHEGGFATCIVLLEIVKFNQK
ncbi:4'-phosphopantetheinyl transferase superfamily protein [Ruminococcaceae bacterium OttesenSCG-928-N02]|nr:4'-phosphopantetheinyl transferase superfamily protein [Ruminococcaceae bacterium OttesenSCG-928-N02]